MPRGRRAASWAVLVGLPIAVHWPIWTGWLSIDPIYRFSGLCRSIWMHGVLPGEAYVDGNAGVTTQALGVLAAHDWLGGTVPWWNPYSGIGLPLAGEMQPAAFFLPFLFLLLLPAGVACLKIAVQAVAGCSTFALLRQMGVGRTASLAGGVIFELNGTFAWVAHTPILPMAFMPLLLLGIERAASAAERQDARGWRWITVAIAYSLLAGFPEVAYLDGLLALAWFAWRGARLPPSARAAYVRKTAIGGGLGLLLAAPLLTAFADFLARASVGGHADFGYRMFVPPNLAMLLFPYVAGTVGNHAFWFTIGGTIGLPVAFMASLALCRPGAGGPRVMLAAWVAIGVAAAAGMPVVRPMVEALPLVRQTMFANYMAPSWSMAAAVLCALALDDVGNRRLDRRALGLAAIAALAAATLAVLVSLPEITAVWDANPTSHVVGRSSILWGCGLAGLLCLICLGRPSARRVAALAVVLTLDAVVTFSVPLLGGTERPPLDTAALTFLGGHLGLQRFAAADTIQPNYGAMFGLASINTNYLPNDRAWAAHATAALDPQANQVYFPGSVAGLRDRMDAYGALGVRYVVLPIGTSLPGARQIFRSALTDILELPAYAPYFESVGGACTLSAVARADLVADCKTATTLVRRELYMPGWTAAIDGTSVPVVPWDGLFQSVALPAGHTAIRFDFRPPGARWAEAAMASAAIVFALCLRRRRLA